MTLFTQGSEDDGLATIVAEFLSESHEGLGRLEQDLVQFEQNPTESALLSGIFRTVHTIKGTAGALGFSNLEQFSHIAENLLSALRDGSVPLNREVFAALFAMADTLCVMLQRIKNTGSDGGVDQTEQVEKMTALAALPAARQPRSGTEGNCVADAVIPRNPHNQALKANPRGLDLKETTIRVKTTLVDCLIHKVSELVQARNRILQTTARVEDRVLLAAYQSLNQTTSELQECIMKTRMQPIGALWGKYRRLIRDLALELGKEVNIQMEGENTELDRTLIEAIDNPLTHLIRNAVDHGIEHPATREAAGKMRHGTLTLCAFQKDGNIHIEIGDDGAGIDPEKIKIRACQLGFVTDKQLAQMNESEITRLIFHPGFSIASTVTKVSGRGVGMDVVRTNIESISGALDIYSEPGRGTTVKIRIPLTLAVIPALIVSCGGERYLLPQINLLEVIHLQGDDIRNDIETIQGSPVYRLRERLLPLVFLDRLLDVASMVDEGQRSTTPDALRIVVLQANDKVFGLVVDDIGDTAEVVVKPLGRLLRGLAVYSGAAVMGDGKVALILDPFEIAQRARLSVNGRDHFVTASVDSLVVGENLCTLLIVEGPDATRLALPLSSVVRLAKIPRSKVEMAGSRFFMQYCRQIVPLVFLHELLPERRKKARRTCGSPVDAMADDETLSIVVHSLEGRDIGVVVGRIVDIVEQNVTATFPASRRGVLCTAVVDGHITELVDMGSILRAQGEQHDKDQSVLHVLS